MPQPNVCDLLKGQRFEGFLLVRSSDQRTGGNGAKYLDLNLADRTGEVNAKVWDGNVPPPAPGSVHGVGGAGRRLAGDGQVESIKHIRRYRMTETIIVALITGGLSLLGVIITSNKTTRDVQAKLDTQQAVTDTKLDELTREVREHNNFARRVPVMEEQIKVINHRLADLEQTANH